MGSSCSRLRPTKRTSPAQASGNQLVSMNQVASNPQQPQHEHSGRSNKLNPITVKDRKTDPLHSKDADGKIPTEESVEVPINVKDEDVCPICFEEYSAENPKLITQCKHEYHFGCMLEWMTRSCTCPICRAGILLDDCIICCD